MNNIENGIYSYNEDITNLETNKQDALTFDQTPTDESTNPVTSVGIKNAIEAAVDVTAPGIYETASGSIASFADGADDLPLKSCVVSINPIQEGEGDPSPENVRPISGRTELNVSRTRFNMWDEEWEVGGISEYGNNTTSTANIRSKNYITILPSAAYYLYVGSNVNMRYFYYDENKNFILWGDGNNVVRTAPKNARYLRFRMVQAYGTTYKNDICINLSDPTKNGTYEPYEGNTYSVNWETEAGTVYGGTLDVVSGKLMVDRAKTTLDGTNTVANVVVKDGFTNCRISGYTPVAKNYATPTTYPKAVCSDAKVIAVYYAWQNQDIPTANSFTVNGSYIGMSIPGSFADADAIKAYLATHNVDVCYEITTPTEIQLTQQEVRTLLGVNNIWSDGGDMAVEYPADTKMYIDQKITEAIAAALA